MGLVLSDCVGRLTTMYHVVEELVQTIYITDLDDDYRPCGPEDRYFLCADAISAVLGCTEKEAIGVMTEYLDRY